jgi:hypothetical protein
MFDKLKTKWGVDALQLTLILITFAIGGTLCARVGGYILRLIFADKNIYYWLLYLPMLTILWPSCVILVSIFTGQYRFFMNYLAKMGRRFGMLKDSDKNQS